MSENNGSFDVLRDFALKTGRETAFTEVALEGHYNRKFNSHKRTAVLYNDKGLSLISYSDPSSILKTGMFSGVFFSSNIDLQKTFTVVKRDFLDNFSFSRGNKTGNSFIDKKLKAESNDNMLLSSVFHSHKIRNALLDIFKSDPRYIFGLNTLKMDFVSAVEFKSVMGFYVLKDWLFDYSSLNYLFEKAKIIKDELDTRFPA